MEWNVCHMYKKNIRVLFMYFGIVDTMPTKKLRLYRRTNSYILLFI